MRMGEKLNKMTYPNYLIYDLNDRNAATPVNIKELQLKKLRTKLKNYEFVKYRL